MHPSVKVQIAPSSVPATPSWFGEVAVLAHVLTQFGDLDAIQQRARFARARFGLYDTIDFVVVLIGYAVSGEPTLKAFYERLWPFASTFMALFGRNALPCHSTLSRFLAALDQPGVEALRLLFQEDLVARSMFGSPPGGVWDRLGKHWFLVDIDGTKQAARQRALPQTKDLPAPHRRFDRVCAKGYFGRKRGQVGRTRTTVLQPYTHQWLAPFQVQETAITEQNCDKRSKPSRCTRPRLRFPSPRLSCGLMGCTETRLLSMRFSPGSWG